MASGRRHLGRVNAGDGGWRQQGSGAKRDRLSDSVRLGGIPGALAVLAWILGTACASAAEYTPRRLIPACQGAPVGDVKFYTGPDEAKNALFDDNRTLYGPEPSIYDPGCPKWYEVNNSFWNGVWGKFYIAEDCDRDGAYRFHWYAFSYPSLGCIEAYHREQVIEANAGTGAILPLTANESRCTGACSDSSGKAPAGLMTAADPINLGTGNVFFTDTDLSIPGPFDALTFSRHYNSQYNAGGVLGTGWRHNWDYSVIVVDADRLRIQRPDGGSNDFDRIGEGLYADAHNPGVTVVRVDDDGDSGWRWSLPDGRSFRFDDTGRFQEITTSTNTIVLSHDEDGRIVSVTDAASLRSIAFHYRSDGRLGQVSGPATAAVADGVYVFYDYEANHLTRVRHADGGGFSYRYEDSGNDPPNLSEKRNRAGHFIASWIYDSQDRAVENHAATGEGGSVSYLNTGETRFVNSYGQEKTVRFGFHRNSARAVQVTGSAGCVGCGNEPIRLAYDDTGRVAEKEFASGNIISYRDFDARGNPGTIVEAVGTAQERTTRYAWHPSLNRPVSRETDSVISPGESAVTTWDYDDDGNDTSNENPTPLLHRIVRSGFSYDPSGETVAALQVTTLSYNQNRQIVQIDGPLPGDADLTVFSYNPVNGDLLRVTNPLVGDTTYFDHDAAGRPGGVAAPDGRVVTYTYDASGRVKTATTVITGETFTYGYHPTGQPAFLTLPNGVTTTFAYEAEYGRLARLADPLGNAINYGYDSHGNISQITTTAPSDQVMYRIGYDFDGPEVPGKPYRTLFADGGVEEYGYDGMGRLSSTVDANGNATSFDYDILGRLNRVSLPGDTITLYGYDAHDNLVSVTDAEGQETRYVVDDFGRIVKEISADAGTTRCAYDPAGNMTSRTDAMGITTTFTYDALNRLTGIQFPDSAQNVTYTYDDGANGIGRLTGMSDPSGSTVYRYDALGRLAAEERTIGGQTYTTAYGYDAAGVLTSMVYPDGREIGYVPDAAGHITQITTTVDGATTTLASGISYLPFGPVTQMTLGNGTAIDKTFDETYRITHLTAGTHMDRIYGMDNVGNITVITDILDPTRNQSFAYDDLYRLTGATGIYGTIGYTYDRVGSRLSRTENGETDAYSYVPGTHRLESVSGANPVQFSYDANGSTTAMGDRSLIYNQNKRLVQVVENASVLGEYIYNGQGQRIKKTADGKTTVFHWDRYGNVIGESDTDGNFSALYVYLGMTRLAALRPGNAPDEISVKVATDEGRSLSGVKVYAFTEAGAYTGKSAVTGEEGTAVFAAADFSNGTYQFRVDYLSDRFWSEVVSVPGASLVSVDIPEAATTVQVIQAEVPVSGVKVYLFNESGSYLGQYQTTDGDGQVTFVLPEGQGYRFRADLLGSRYFSELLTVTAGQSAPVAVDTGGGMLSFILQKSEGAPMAGVKTYLFSEAGSYLGVSMITGADGKADYTVSSGTYRIRSDYLGYQYWSNAIVVAADTAATLALPHQDVTVTVAGDNAGDIQARSGVKVYLFTAAGSYQGVNAVTDENGQTVLSLPASAYKVRADYLGQQFWSEPFTQADAAVTIPEGNADIMVARLNQPLDGVPVYVFTAAGSYLGLNGASDEGAPLSFRLPAGDYNFRADYLGSRYFSGNTTVIANQINPVTVSTGGGNFTLTVQETAGVPMAGVKCYLFSEAGAYLGHQVVTSADGLAPFDLADGSYKIRVDTLGYQHWTPLFTVPTEREMAFDIPHQDVTITVQTDDGSTTWPAAGVKTYLFTEAGSYQGVSITTDSGGQAAYHLPANAYNIRADYFSQQYWSDPTVQENKTVTIAQGIATVQVSQGTSLLENVKVYAFTAAGAYLGLNATTDASGEAAFTLPVGSYKFRADYQDSQFWATATVSAGIDTPVALSTGGGSFLLTVQTDAGTPIADIPVYVFSTSGSYLSINARTDETGVVQFDLADGGYTFRADYLGYQHWSDICTVPGTLSDVLSLPHTDVTVTVNEVYGTDSDPISGVKVYLFSAGGAYQSLNATTDAAGQVSFSLPNQNYKVRADYLGRQFWSDVFNSMADVAVDIAHGYADIHVTDLGADVAGASVYLFTETGSYLSRMLPTDAAGTVSFIVPAGGYKFRVDHGGSQYWSDVVNVLANEVTPIEMALDLLALDDTLNPHPHRFDAAPPEYKPEPVYLASLVNLTGLLANTLVAAAPNDAVYYYLNDHLGTPQKMIDAQGNVVWEADIKPFGQATISTETVPNHFRFAGQYFDAETGLHYNYHRYYDFATGRYLAADPIGLEGGGNLFAYAQNNPSTYFDPWALTAEQIEIIRELAKKSQSDLPVPDVIFTGDLSGDNIGFANPVTGNVTLDVRYLEVLNCEQLVDLYELIVHESIHRSRRIDSILRPVHHPDIYDEAKRRTEERIDNIKKKCSEANLCDQ